MRWVLCCVRALIQLCALCGWCGTLSVYADTVDKGQAAAIPVGSIVHTATTYRPTGTLPATDALYLNYFLKNDATISRWYQDKWLYHETQTPYTVLDWNQNAHFTLGTSANAPTEVETRRDFASQVLRLRLNSMLQDYFKGSKAAQDVKHVQARYQATAEKLNKIKNIPIRIAIVANHPVEFRFGYDVFNDAGKVEISQGALQAGVYHGHLLSAATGGRPPLTDLSLKFSATIAPLMSTASVSYTPATTVMVATLSKALSPRVSTSLTSSTPTLAGAAPCNYGVQVAYQL